MLFNLIRQTSFYSYSDKIFLGKVNFYISKEKEKVNAVRGNVK